VIQTLAMPGLRVVIPQAWRETDHQSVQWSWHKCYQMVCGSATIYV